MHVKLTVINMFCSLFRARLCWGGGGGGSVAIAGFVLYAGWDYALHLTIMLLVQVMAYVMSYMFAHIYSGALDMRTRIRPAEWCTRGSDLAGSWDLCRRLESQSSRTVSLTLSS